MSENNKSLPQLVQTSQVLIQALLESNGEITPEIEAALIEVDVKLPQKIDNYQAVLDRLDMESEYWSARAESFAKMAKGCKSAKERLKDSLKFAMKALETDELIGNDCRFKLSNSKPKMIIDQIELEPSYYMQVTTTEVDKKKIEEDLKLGVPVKGARLEEVKSIRSYLNKGSK